MSKSKCKTASCVFLEPFSRANSSRWRIFSSPSNQKFSCSSVCFAIHSNMQHVATIHSNMHSVTEFQRLCWNLWFVHMYLYIYTCILFMFGNITCIHAWSITNLHFTDQYLGAEQLNWLRKLQTAVWKVWAESRTPEPLFKPMLPFIKLRTQFPVKINWA